VILLTRTRVRFKSIIVFQESYFVVYLYYYYSQNFQTIVLIDIVDFQFLFLLFHFLVLNSKKKKNLESYKEKYKGLSH